MSNSKTSLIVAAVVAVLTPATAAFGQSSVAVSPFVSYVPSADTMSPNTMSQRACTKPRIRPTMANPIIIAMPPGDSTSPLNSAL